MNSLLEIAQGRIPRDDSTQVSAWLTILKLWMANFSNGESVCGAVQVAAPLTRCHNSASNEQWRAVSGG
jgi:hypothetical protein